MGSFVTPETLEQVARDVSRKKVREVMSHPVITIQEDAPVAAVADLMLRRSVSRLPVMRGKEMVGIITRHDLVKLMTAGQAES